MTIIFASNKPDVLDFWVDNNSIMFEVCFLKCIFERKGVGYGSASQYYYINAGFRTFTAYPTGTKQNPAIQFYAILEDDGGLFTLVIYGSSFGFKWK